MKFSLNNIIPNKVSNENIIKSSVWNNKLEFQKGDYYLISSSSGKGKSTLTSFLSGVRTDFTGDILIDKKNTQSLTSKNWIELRKNQIALVHQDLKLIANLTVIENLLLKNELTEYSTIENIDNYLTQLEVFELKEKKCSELSMGQQQRIAIIRSILQPFNWIILDEPFSHLDKKNKSLALDLIIKSAKNNDAGIILMSLDTNEKLNSFKSIEL